MSYFSQKEKNRTSKDLSDFMDIVIRQDHYLEKIRKLFIDELIEISLGNEKAGQEKAMQAIEIMHLDDDDFVENHQLELENIQRLYMK